MEFLYTPYVALFLITAIGIVIGKITIKGVSLSVTAILLVALFFGHYGIVLPVEIKNIGLILFIYSIGIQAGPGFFSSIKRKSLPLFLITFIVVFFTGFVVYIIGYFLHFNNSIIAGVYAGSLSSSAALAAAAAGIQETELASVAFGISYPIGIIATILFLIIAPKLFKVNIQKEESKYIAQKKEENPDITVKHYILENPNLFGKSIAESGIRTITGTSIIAMQKNNSSLIPTPDTLLEAGDIVKASGTPKVHEALSLLIGKETEQTVKIHSDNTVTQMLVTNKNVLNKSLYELSLNTKYDAVITHIRRSGIDIIPTSDVTLRFSDKITLSAPKNRINEIATLIGESKDKLNDIDFLPISIGILIGILIGSISIPLFGDSFKLGFSGGVLISGMILSRIGKTGTIVWNIAGAQNQFLQKLGLIFFMSAVGTEAGAHFLDHFHELGLQMIATAIAISIIPMLVGIIVGKFFKLNFITILGTLSGAMTSTPGLNAIEKMSDSNAARLAYAVTYPLAIVSIIITCRILIML